MKQAGKYAVALAVAAAGSVFLGSLPAGAGGIELDRVDIVFKRNHDDACGPGGCSDAPPAPPQAHMPPPHGGPGGPGGPRGHMPPPHPGFAGKPGGPGGPRGHMPPPHRGGPGGQGGYGGQGGPGGQGGQGGNSPKPKW